MWKSWQWTGKTAKRSGICVGADSLVCSSNRIYSLIVPWNWYERKYIGKIIHFSYLAFLFSISYSSTSLWLWKISPKWNEIKSKAYLKLTIKTLRPKTFSPSFALFAFGFWLLLLLLDSSGSSVQASLLICVVNVRNQLMFSLSIILSTSPSTFTAHKTEIHPLTEIILIDVGGLYVCIYGCWTIRFLVNQ